MNHTVFKKRLHLVLWLQLLCVAVAFAQTDSASAGEERTTLFTYGMPVETSETYFKNLFKNFSCAMDNSGGVKLDRYKYVGTMKNKRMFKKILQHNLQEIPHFVWFYATAGTDDVGKKTLLSLIIQQDELDVNIDDIVNRMADEHIGDEVWQVDFFAGLNPYSSYVLINPETKAIYEGGYIWGMEIPVSSLFGCQ